MWRLVVEKLLENFKIKFHSYYMNLSRENSMRSIFEKIASAREGEKTNQTLSLLKPLFWHLAGFSPFLAYLNRRYTFFIHITPTHQFIIINYTIINV